jgi:hypothetical protein
MSVLARTANDPPPQCATCGGAQVTRLLSRFAAPRSEDARLEALADPSRLGDVDEHDPKSVARWMNRLGRETGEEMGDEFQEDIERAAEEVSGDGDTGAEDVPGANDLGASDE